VSDVGIARSKNASEREKEKWRGDRNRERFSRLEGKINGSVASSPVVIKSSDAVVPHLFSDKIERSAHSCLCLL